MPARGPLSLAEYAAVRVALARSPDAPRATLLRSFRLDVVSWALEAARWAKRLDDDASRGDTKRIDELVSTIRRQMDEPEPKPAEG